MASWNVGTFNIANINNGERYENGQIVDADAVNAPIEAAAYIQNLLLSRFPEQVVGDLQTIGKTYSVWGEVSNSATVPIHAHIQYTRIVPKRGTFRISGTFPSNTDKETFTIFSTEKINALFANNHSITFSPTGEYGSLVLENWVSPTSGVDLIGYSMQSVWVSSGIGFGRIYTENGDYGSWALDNFEGAFIAEMMVNEV